MGGDVQPQIHVQVLTKLLDFNVDIQEAIEAPRWVMLGTIYQPDEHLYLEKRFPSEVVDRLKERGHRIVMMPELWDVAGHAQGVVIDSKGVLKAGADPRGDGAAIGY
jgi:gamma-glutamyltranspeptidase/glutathione hydrolase